MPLVAWLKQISEFATDGVFLVEEEPARIVFCNGSACEQSGYDRSELVDASPSIFLGAALGEEAKLELGSPLWESLPVRSQILNYRKDGTPYPVNLALFALPGSDNKTRRWIGLQNDLSKEYAMEEKLASAKLEAGLFQKRLWDAIEALPDAFVMYDKDDRLVVCNDKYKEFYAASADAIYPGASFQDIMRFGVGNGQYPEAVGREEEWLEAWQGRHRKPTEPIERELPGDRFIVLHDVITDNGDLVGLRTDVTELRQQKNRLEEQKRFVELLLNRNPAIVMSQGRDWKIQTCSDAWTQQFGYSRDETVGRDLTEFMPPEDAKRSREFRENRLQADNAPPIIKNILTIATKTGEVRSVELQSIIENDNGEWRNLIAMTDITPIILAKDELERLVENDELTGLMSRRGLQRHFADGQRKKDLGFFLIDLDHFKSVNDGYGHEAGDDLLKAVAESLVRLTSSVGCPVRLGGEEFAVFRPWKGWQEAAEFAEELRSTVEQTSISFQGKLIQRSASIGYIAVKTGDELHTAMHLADLAQREAKSTGRNKCLAADVEMLRILDSRGAFIRNDQVQAALEAGDFFYVVQPIVHAGNERITGFEALIRWRKPDGEIIMPDKFIERLYEVLRQPYFGEFKNKLRVEVLKKLACFQGRYIGFNLIIEEIAYQGSADVIDRVFRDVIAKTNQKIVIEISERAFHSRVDNDLLVGELQKLSDFGYLIALDDFGVESSNIQRLQQFPIDIVKLDKSLIREIVENERQRTTVRSIARMIEDLGLTCIVEGVETEEQANALQKMGLVVHQGYFHALPLLPEEIALRYGGNHQERGLADDVSEIESVRSAIRPGTAIPRHKKSDFDKPSIQTKALNSEANSKGREHGA